MFPIGFFLKIIESRDCNDKGLSNNLSPHQQQQTILGKTSDTLNYCLLLPSYLYVNILRHYPKFYKTTFNPLPNDKILDMTKLKAFSDQKLYVAKVTISLFDRVGNTGKKRRCWLPACSACPKCFPKPSS